MNPKFNPPQAVQENKVSLGRIAHVKPYVKGRRLTSTGSRTSKVADAALAAKVERQKDLVADFEAGDSSPELGDTVDARVVQCMSLLGSQRA